MRFVVDSRQSLIGFLNSFSVSITGTIVTNNITATVKDLTSFTYIDFNFPMVLIKKTVLLAKVIYAIILGRVSTRYRLSRGLGCTVESKLGQRRRLSG